MIIYLAFFINTKNKLPELEPSFRDDTESHEVTKKENKSLFNFSDWITMQSLMSKKSFDAKRSINLI